MARRATSWAAFVVVAVVSVAAGCADQHDLGQRVTSGGAQFLDCVAATVRFHDRTGTWPKEPLDVRADTSAGQANVGRWQRAIAYSGHPEGLAIIDRRSGKLVAVIDAKSTADHIVLRPG